MRGEGDKHAQAQRDDAGAGERGTRFGDHDHGRLQRGDSLGHRGVSLELGGALSRHALHRYSVSSIRGTRGSGCRGFGGLERVCVRHALKTRCTQECVE